MRIGASDLEASVIGLGTWAIGGDSNWGPSDDGESIRTIHRARELGITLLDTAPAYGLGHSEEVVGRALNGRRHDYVLATKCGIRWDIDEGALLLERDGVRLLRNTRPESIRHELETSLRRLNTDYIDLYIVHWQAVPEYPCPIADTMDLLTTLRTEGKIRAIGASNLSREQLQEYIACGPLDLIQEKYSMLDRTAESSFFDLCSAHNITFQAYSPLERGILTGKYDLQTPAPTGIARSRIKWFEPDNLTKIVQLRDHWADLCSKYHCTMTALVVAWTAAQAGGVNVLCGARKTAQIEENAGGAAITLDADDIRRMRADIDAIS